MTRAAPKRGNWAVDAAVLLPLIAFFGSGAAGLVFQTIWTRLLQHVFGSSSVAISSVVSVFMGGLSLGAFLFGKIADRLRHPLRWYGAAEAFIGVTALLVPALVSADGPLVSVNVFLRNHLAVESQAFMWARFVCIVPVLIVPTTLMGGTLPLLSRHMAVHGGGSSSRQVGTLYAVNTAGAVLGVFACGFWLMPMLGVSTTNALAALTNLIIAALMWLLDRWIDGGATTTAVRMTVSVAEAHEVDPTQCESQSARKLTMWVFGLSGMASLSYEVVFSRALVNTIGGSVYSFSLILLTFLIGIASGSGYASRVLLSVGARAGNVALIAATVLTPVAAITTWLRIGLGAYSLQVLACWLTVLSLFFAQRSERQKRDAFVALGEERPPTRSLTPSPVLALTALAVPWTSSALSLSLVRDTLALLLFISMGAIFAVLALCWLLRTRPLYLLGGLQLLIGAAAFSSSLFADRLSVAFASAITPLYDQLDQYVGTVMALMALIAAMSLLPAALAMGGTFPVALEIFGRGKSRVGDDVGLLYTGNTIGSILGAWLPGFVLMPVLGMQWTLLAAVALNFALGAVAIVSARSPELRPRIGLLVVASPVFVLSLVVLNYSHLVPRWDISRMTLGAFRISLAKDVVDEESWGAPELLYYRDGLSTTVTVERWGRHLSLKNNGKVDASSGDDMPTQIMVAAYPLLLHNRGPADLDVAIVGFGSGVTVGAALQFPVRHVTAIELESGVIEASSFFEGVNHLGYRPEYPFAHARRLTVMGDDGRNYLAATEQSYDVIVSEPSNPWLTGVSDLFTRDHFEASKRKLRPDGVYCQWVQLYEMSPENVKIIYRTFASHFRYVVVFSAETLSSDTILVGSDSPLVFDHSRIQRVMEDPVVAAELERAYVQRPQDAFARTLFASREEVMRFAQHEERLEGGRFVPKPQSTLDGPCPAESCKRSPVPINTDDNALIEFSAPKDLIGFERYRGYLNLMYAEDFPYGRVTDRIAGLPTSATTQAELFAALSLSLLAHGRVEDATVALRRMEAALDGVHHSDPEAEQTSLAGRVLTERAAIVGRLLLAGDDASTLGEDLAPYVVGLSAADARGLMTNFTVAQQALQAEDFERAYQALNRLPVPLRHHGGPVVRLLYGYLGYRTGRLRLAARELTELAQLEPDFVEANPAVLYALSRTHYARRHFERGVTLMARYADDLLSLGVTAEGAGDPARADHPASPRPPLPVVDEVP